LNFFSPCLSCKDLKSLRKQREAYTVEVHSSIGLHSKIFSSQYLLIQHSLLYFNCIHRDFQSLLLTFFRERIPSLVSLSVDMENTPEPSPFIIVYFMSAFEPVSASFALILPTADPT